MSIEENEINQEEFEDNTSLIEPIYIEEIPFSPYRFILVYF